MAEKTTGGFRERIFFTDSAWARVESMAERLGLDERTTLRMMIALQLAQLEATLGAAESARVRGAVQQDVSDAAESFLQDEPPPVATRANPGRPVPARPGGVSAPGRGAGERRDAAPARVPGSYLVGRDGRSL